MYQFLLGCSEAEWLDECGDQQTGTPKSPIFIRLAAVGRALPYRCVVVECWAGAAVQVCCGGVALKDSKLTILRKEYCVTFTLFLD